MLLGDTVMTVSPPCHGSPVTQGINAGLRESLKLPLQSTSAFYRDVDLCHPDLAASITEDAERLCSHQVRIEYLISSIIHAFPSFVIFICLGMTMYLTARVWILDSVTPVPSPGT